MTAVLPSPRLRTVDEPRFVPAPRQVHPCPYCHALLGGPLAECAAPACVKRANNFDLNSGWEDS